MSEKNISLHGVVCECSRPPFPKPGFYGLETETGHVWIRLAKALRPTPLALGTSLRVEGHWKSNQAYFKVTQLDEPTTPIVEVCTKGNCRKGGAYALIEQLRAEHPDWTIETTGCLHACQSPKLGANLKIAGQVLRGVSHPSDVLVNP